MIYDRPYMRDENKSEGYTAITVLMLINLAVYIIQHLPMAFDSKFPYEYFALTSDTLPTLKLWALGSYAFLHETASLWHIAGNMILLFFIGRTVEAKLGKSTFYKLYFTCILSGAIAWLIFNTNPSRVIGASGATMGVLILFCLLQPDGKIFLIPFPFPIKAKWLGWATAGYNAWGFLTLEVPGHNSTAYSAHLGGMIGAYMFYKLYMNPSISLFKPEVSIETPSWIKKTTNDISTKFKVNMTNKKELQKEVDRILDKINDHGFGDLSDSEKATLDKAKDLLKK